MTTRFKEREGDKTNQRERKKIKMKNLLTTADVTEDFENNRSASLNFRFLLSALLFVFLRR